MDIINNQSSKKSFVSIAEESTRKAVEHAGNLRRTILNTVIPAVAVDAKSLVGCWYFEAVELSESGLKRMASDQEDYYFNFASDGTVSAHVHGKEYETIYSVTDGCISFGNADLAALKLRLIDDSLRLSNYLGTTLTFVKKKAGRIT